MILHMPCVRWVTSLVVVILLTLANTAPRVVRAQSSLPALAVTVVATGLTLPLAFIQDPSDPRVQFIVEQLGRVRILRDGVLLADDFLNLSGQIAAGGEQGLLGLAFAPDYAASRRFFVNFTNPSGHTVIARYQRSSGDPLRADTASRFDLRWPDGNRFIIQPFANHNGGDLHFGSDGYLYIGMGDGGSGNDPGHLAQSPATLLGKMLRIDVGVADSDPEGYDVPGDNPFVGQPGVLRRSGAFGLRNPFRFTVDARARRQWRAAHRRRPDRTAGKKSTTSRSTPAAVITAGATARGRTTTSRRCRPRFCRSSIRSSSTTARSARRSSAASSIGAPVWARRSSVDTSTRISGTDACGRFACCEWPEAMK